MFRCRHHCRRHLVCPSPAAPRKAMPHSPNVTVAVDAGLLISRLAARYAHPPAHLWPEMSPRASCQQSSGALPHRLGSSSSSTALRTLVRSDEPRVGPLSAGRRRLHPPSRAKPRHTTIGRKLLTRSGTNHPVFSPSTCLIERRGAALIQRTETSKPFLRNGVFCFLYRCGPCPLWRAFRQDRWARSIAIFKQP